MRVAAHQISQNDKHVLGSFRDPAKTRELARRCDMLTVEIEHVGTNVLEEIATVGVDVGSSRMKKVAVHPSWETLHLIQDQYLQTEHFREEGMPIAPQMTIISGADILDSLQDSAQNLGFPFMLKARKES
jgi:phosphoribosylaminoimidazole carboxylase